LPKRSQSVGKFAFVASASQVIERSKLASKLRANQITRAKLKKPTTFTQANEL